MQINFISNEIKKNLFRKFINFLEMLDIPSKLYFIMDNDNITFRSGIVLLLNNYLEYQKIQNYLDSTNIDQYLNKYNLTLQKAILLIKKEKLYSTTRFSENQLKEMLSIVEDDSPTKIQYKTVDNLKLFAKKIESILNLKNIPYTKIEYDCFKLNIRKSMILLIFDKINQEDIIEKLKKFYPKSKEIILCFQKTEDIEKIVDRSKIGILSKVKLMDFRYFVNFLEKHAE